MKCHRDKDAEVREKKKQHVEIFIKNVRSK